MYLLGLFYAVFLVLLVRNSYYYLHEEKVAQVEWDIDSDNSTTLAYDYCQAGKLSPFKYKPLKNAELLKVQVITRHGDRTPEVGVIPGDKTVWDCNPVHGYGYSELEDNTRQSLGTMEMENYVKIPDLLLKGKHFWKGSCDLGQLTPKGAQQHMQLGKVLREIYAKRLGFLPEEFPKSQDKQNGLFAARSTDYKRTQQSARFLLTGLYPNEFNKKRQPLKLAIYPAKLETMRPSTFSKPGICPRLEQLEQEYAKSPELAELHNSTAALRARLLKRMNTTHEISPDLKGNSIKNFFDSLMPRHCHGFPMPCRNEVECVTPMDMEELLQAAIRENRIRFGGTPISHAISQLSSSSFIKEIKASVLATIANSKAVVPKFELYSGHDTTLSSLLSVLRIKELPLPPFASNMIIELWKLKKKGKNYAIRIWFNGAAIQTKWCDFEAGCDLDTFLQFLAQNTPEDLGTACENV